MKSIYGLLLLALSLASLISALNSSLAQHLWWAALAVFLLVWSRVCKKGVADVQYANLPVSGYAFAVVVCFQLFFPNGTSVDTASFTLAKMWVVILAVLIACLCTSANARKLRGGIWPAGVYGALALFALASLGHSQYVYTWSIAPFAFFMAISLYGGTRAADDPILSRWNSYFFRWTMYAAILVTGVGAVRGANVLLAYEALNASYDEGNFDELNARAAALVEAGGTLQIEHAVLERATAGLMARVLDSLDAEALDALINMAIETRQWTFVKQLYETANAMQYGIAQDRFSYNAALLETGQTERAIENLIEMHAETPLSEIELTKLMLMQKRSVPVVPIEGREQIAQQILRERFFTGGRNAVYGTIGDVFGDSLLGQIQQVSSPFELVRLMEDWGGKVYHAGQLLGTSGIGAPVDIVACSGGGSDWNREGIWVGGQQVSLRKRGYNIAVVHPQSGAVVDVATFDTWEKLSEGLRLGEYLAQVQHGYIVVGTINDEGSSGLVAKSKRAMQGLGVTRLPVYWGSHAFIGVQGARERSVIEWAGSQDQSIVLGVLGSNSEALLVGDRDQLLDFLRSEAENAPGGFAVYIEGLGADDIFAGALAP